MEASRIDQIFEEFYKEMYEHSRRYNNRLDELTAKVKADINKTIRESFQDRKEEMINTWNTMSSKNETISIVEECIVVTDDNSHAMQIDTNELINTNVVLTDNTRNDVVLANNIHTDVIAINTNELLDTNIGTINKDFQEMPNSCTDVVLYNNIHADVLLTNSIITKVTVNNNINTEVVLISKRVRTFENDLFTCVNTDKNLAMINVKLNTSL